MTLVEKGRHDDELIDALMVCGRESRATPDMLPIQTPLVPEGDSYDPGPHPPSKEMWVREGVFLESKPTAGKACLCGHSLMVLCFGVMSLRVLLG